MKKGNKRLFVVAVLLLLVAISFSTYAIYKSSAIGTASADVAAWVVKVNKEDITKTDTFTFSASDIVWETNSNVKEGKIAPGSKGTITFEIDASESEVAVDYTVALDTTSLDNEKIAVTNTGANTTGTINYSDIAANMKKTITINVVWNAEEVNTKDMAMAGSTIEIQVTVTATQHTGT